MRLLDGPRPPPVRGLSPLATVESGWHLCKSAEGALAWATVGAVSRGEAVYSMAKEKDPAEVVSAIRRSIEVSQRGARRVRAHRFKELFGYQALSAQRRERIEGLLQEAGILVQPSLEQAGRDDWLVMSIPVTVDVQEAHPDPRPTMLLEHLQTVRPDTEREVEMHFASPLFQGLGYAEDQEAAGFGIRVYQGSRPHSTSRRTCCTSPTSDAI